jgi:hypothetical protein
MSEKITARMKWIVKQLKKHEGLITHRRDWLMEKSFYTLDWTDGEGYHCVEVTDKMRNQLSTAGLIEIVEERPVYSKGKFRTTERDWGLPSLLLHPRS